jgi:RimJ/RimL family protein N-acetyltransferase
MSISINDVKGSLLLKGAQVELRTFVQENLTDRYLDWLRDPKLMRYSNQRFRSHDLNSCRNFLASFDNTDNLFIAIYNGYDFIGTATAFLSSVHRTADIGLLICSDVQGKGLGKDAWATLMDHLLATGTRKVTGGTLRCNVAMVRIMQGCGMQPDGVRFGQELVNGEVQDMLHFAKFSQPKGNS